MGSPDPELQDNIILKFFSKFPSRYLVFTGIHQGPQAGISALQCERVNLQSVTVVSN